MPDFLKSHPAWLLSLDDDDEVPFGDRSEWLKHVDYPLVRVSKTAFVERRENVSDNARVYGNAWVADDAQVYGEARVSDNVRVSGEARVYGNAWVADDARVYGNARVYGKARVSGNARVSGSAQVYGNARVYGEAQVYGKADIRQTDDYMTVGPIGSRRSTLTMYRVEKDIQLTTGCFTGTEQKFMARLLETPEHIEYWKVVPVLLQVLRQRCGLPPPQRGEIG